jgi:hypothetical protein
MSNDETILQISHLVTTFDTEEGRIRAVDALGSKKAGLWDLLENQGVVKA